MSLGNPQRIAYEQFCDCLKRTKKKVDADNSDGLIYFMLDTCSVIANDNRSYQATIRMLNLINERLCPGTWCCRYHCKNYSSRHAYNCSKTRPSVCAVYKKYIEKKELKSKEQSAT